MSQVLGSAAFLGQMGVTPDGSKLYVNSSFSAQPGLLVIDAKTLTVSTMVPIYVGTSVAVTPDGRFAYVPNFGSSTI